MKTQIRRNVFETNSSNEHSLTIINGDMFKKWKAGEVLARVKSRQESDVSWGNFWSELYTLEFTDDFESAKTENENIFKALIQNHLEFLEEYKKRCLEHVPTGDDYEDNYLYKFDEAHYEKEKKEYQSYTIEDASKHFGLAESKMWMSYEEFYKDWIEENDCYSPFEHEDTVNNVYIIGKYYHS